MSGDYNLTPEQYKELFETKYRLIQTIPPKKKIYGSRRAIRRVLKARKEKEHGE
jgi:hypothetical protein